MSATSVFAENAVTSTAEDDKTDPTDIVEVADKALKVDITALEQEYPSLRTGFKLDIDSEVDSGRVTIQWYYPSTLYKIEGDAKTSTMLTSGAPFSVNRYFNPTVSAGKLGGVTMFTIGVKVSALVYEQNYITIVKKNFYLDSNFQLLPITDTYRQAKTEYEVTKILGVLAIAGISSLVVSFALGKFLNYVNSPDKEK